MKQDQIDQKLEPSQSSPQILPETQAIPSQNKKPMILLIGMILFVLIGTMAYWFGVYQHQQGAELLNKQLNPTITLVPSKTSSASSSGAIQQIMLLSFNKESLNTPKFSTNNPEVIVKETYSALKNSGNFVNNSNIKLVPPSPDKMWWITNDNYNVLALSNHIYYWIQGDDVYQVDHQSIPVVKDFIEVLGNVLVTNGFKINQKNSSDYQIDKKVFYDYIIAYENGDTKCTVLVNPDTGSIPSDAIKKNTGFDVNFNCTDSVQMAYQEQIPFLQALINSGGSGALSYWKNNIIVTNIEIKEGSAQADIYGRRAGAYALFVRQDNKWVKIYDGQNIPDCKTLQDNNFSKQFSLNCVDYPNNQEIDYSTGKLYLKFGK